MSYLLCFHNLSSLVLNSNTVLEFTVSSVRLFQTGMFLNAKEFNLTDLLALGLFSFKLWPLN